MSFQDHFSGDSGAYARFRPRYPAALFSWLASLTPGHDLAWDAGTGSGQAAIALIRHFRSVVATDASAEQLAQAERHERVTYRCEPSHRASIVDQSVDIITAGAAAHWFELDDFYAEVRRVARPGAIVALFSYGPRDLADAIHPAVHHYQEVVLRDYWPERIGLVHDRYATLPFPFEEIEAPSFTMSAEWTLAGALAFLETWSASQRYRRERGTLPTDSIAAELAKEWDDPERLRRFEIALFMRVGRVS